MKIAKLIVNDGISLIFLNWEKEILGVYLNCDISSMSLNKQKDPIYNSYPFQLRARL